MLAKKKWYRWWILALLLVSLMLIAISSWPQNRERVALPMATIVVTVTGE